MPSNFVSSISQTEQSRVNALAQSLHGWRVLAVRLDSVLHWEQPPALGALLACVTAVFLLIGWFQPPLVALAALIGLLLLLADFAVPLAANRFVGGGAAAWTDADESRFADVCSRLLAVWDQAIGLASQLLMLRRERPQFYLAIALPALISLLVLAEKVNNLFLCYAAVVTVLLVPGLRRSGVAARAAKQLVDLLRSRIQGARKAE